MKAVISILLLVALLAHALACPAVSSQSAHALLRKPTEGSCSCPKILAPVCGVNGERYDNTCLAEDCAGVRVASNRDPQNGCRPYGARGPARKQPYPSETGEPQAQPLPFPQPVPQPGPQPLPQGGR